MTTFYRCAMFVLRPFMWICHPYRVVGRKNIPSGPALVCANHSHLIDPILLALAFGRRNVMYFMAKAELFKNPLLRFLLKGLGAFPVNRGQQDILAIKTALRHIKDGKKVMIFPEGTRVSEDDAVSAKSGAIRLASKTGVPIVPVHIPREKKLFAPLTICIGEAYQVNADTKESYAEQAELLMEKIKNLRECAS